MQATTTTKVFLAGIGCVGKTAIGARLAECLGCAFADLDAEIEEHFGRPIGRLKAEAMTPYSFRKDYAAVVLKKVIGDHEGAGLVVALPPSGLMRPLHPLINGRDRLVVVLDDTPDNIVRRLVFYDDESRPVTMTLTDEDRRRCRKSVAEDMAYFERSFRRADLRVEIAGLDVEGSAAKIVAEIIRILASAMVGASSG